jgi:prevent-host-death family protein
MITFTANDAKQQLGHVLDTARTAPVSITKHGRPSFVITSQQDYDLLLKLKFEHFKREVQIGFGALDRGEISNRSIAGIAAEAVEIHKKNSSSRSVQ